MPIRLLLISDIHGNYPALQAIDRHCGASSFDYIINCGDSLVYAPFPNETLLWLAKNRVISILGNTDQKIIKLRKGKSFKKPGKPEKRIMYTSTAAALSDENSHFLCSLKKSAQLQLSPSGRKAKGKKILIGIFHGSPADHKEFLFANTPDARFHELAALTKNNIILTGHSHTPYHKYLSDVHFINPGSVGRMFDGDPRTSFATLTLTTDSITVQHFRISYNIQDVIDQITTEKLPEIYATMYQLGKKLN